MSTQPYDENHPIHRPVVIKEVAAYGGRYYDDVTSAVAAQFRDAELYDLAKTLDDGDDVTAHEIYAKRYDLYYLLQRICRRTADEDGIKLYADDYVLKSVEG